MTATRRQAAATHTLAALLLGVTTCTVVLVMGGIAGVKADAAHSSAHIVPLNDAEWEETPGLGASTRGEVAVNFFAPWCGQCKLLAPVWAQSAAVLHAAASPIVIGSVDCTLNPEVCSEQNIKGYPTILFFRDGHRVGSSYDGERTVAKIVDWVQTKSTQPKRPVSIPAAAPATPAAGVATAAAEKAAAASAAAADDSAASTSATCTDEASCSYPQTVLNQLKALIRSFVANPTRVVVAHPFACVALVYLIGLCQGAFMGVIWALRENTRITRAIPAAALGPVPAGAHLHQH